MFAHQPGVHAGRQTAEHCTVGATEKTLRHAAVDHHKKQAAKSRRTGTFSAAWREVQCVARRRRKKVIVHYSQVFFF